MNKLRHDWLLPLILAVVGLLSVNSGLANEYRNLPDKMVEIKFLATGMITVMDWCPETHCSQVNSEVNDGCRLNGYSHGYPLSVVDPARTGQCACPCGCLTGDTLIMLSNREFKRADTLIEGDQIMVMTALGLRSAPIALVTRSSLKGYQVQQITLSDGSFLSGSSNHTVLNQYNKLVTLDSIAIGTQLRHHDGSLVEVVTNEKIRLEKVDLMNVMVNIDSTLPLHHVYVTNHLLSGDMLAQLTRDATGEEVDLLWDRVDLSHLPPSLQK
jgi:hypothetical protein